MALGCVPNPEWSSQWGGEPLIADETTRFPDSTRDDLISVTRAGGALEAKRIRIPPDERKTR